MPKVTNEKIKKSKKSIKKKNQNVQENTKDNKFSFDEEIVIGLKRIDEPQKVKKNKTSKKIKAIFGSLITLQLIACEIANILKRNPDQPKGLKKVVRD